MQAAISCACLLLLQKLMLHMHYLSCCHCWVKSNAHVQADPRLHCLTACAAVHFLHLVRTGHQQGGCGRHTCAVQRTDAVFALLNIKEGVSGVHASRRIFELLQRQNNDIAVIHHRT